ncbi:hypothetical protein [Bauldia sp.]|uniref:hypothetical protein n=1 Tax=Bauldia sp. TaxID=2575872 RepID=UPI003BA8D0B2
MTTSTAGAADESAPSLNDFLSGLFLGLLVGGLVGISVSQLTGDVLAGLLALLAAFFGLGGKMPGTAPVTKVRLIAFSIAVLVGVSGGILVRTHGLLAPPLKAVIEDYKEAGLPDELAQALAVFDQTGLRTGNLAAAPAPEKPTKAGFTFGAESLAQCSALSETVFATPELRLGAMEKAGAPWDQAGQFGLTLPDDQRAGFADLVHSLLCDQTE